MQTEKQLLTLVQKYDQRALAEVYDRYSPGLYRYAVRLLGNADLAEDCVADTFSRFLDSLKRGSGPRQYLRAYLYRIAHNWITDQYRRQPPPHLPLEAQSVDERSPGPDVEAEQRIAQEEVRAAIAQLTDAQRQVVVLKFLEGWQNREIAQVLNKPVGAVKALQHRGLESLRRTLQIQEEALP